ncbi:MAG: hypothetical protein KDA85_15595 [Planctomycetaceae bacterium]|nr:hypothetical protein [Planctomycetaceae bacterium]
MTTTSSSAGSGVPHERTVRYLKAALRQNPVFESARILNLRDRYLGNARTGTTAPIEKPDLTELRAEIEQQIQQLRATFWSTDLTELRSQLSSVPVSSFPDLQHAVRRLQVVAAHRHLFPQLAEIGAASPDVFRAFREILVAPPFEAAAARQRALFRMNEFNTARSLVKAIRKVMPEVYQLEADWLGTVKKQQRMVAADENARTSFEIDRGSLGWILRILILVTVVALHLLAMSSRS